jgi:serine/threonine protein kinase
MGARGLERLSPPTEIGAYEIRKLLGRGATAAVYECRHRTLGRLAAVKVLHPHLARDPVAAARFLREGRAISRIVHPNVIEVFDVGEHDGAPYLVMSLVDGEDLTEHIRRLHPMSLADIADCILPVIAAVASAHDAGIIHRDLKPSNIRLTRDHRGILVPKVLDFGISKLAEDDQATDLTDTDGALGTASYMAPEQLRSAKRVDARCDVYALGVILYECSTGLRPFRGASGYDLMHAVLTAPVALPSFLRPEIPTEFDAVVLRAMRREPSERYACARDLGHALAPFASDPAARAAEFAPRRGDTIVAAPSKAESAEPSFTLVSGSQARGNVPASRMPIAIGACAAGVVLVCAVAVVAGRAGSPISSASAVSAAQRPAGVSAPTSSASASVRLLQAETSEPAEPSKAPMSAAVVEPRTQRVRLSGPRDSVLPTAPASSRGTPRKDETGTNGAPILE